MVPFLQDGNPQREENTFLSEAGLVRTYHSLPIYHELGKKDHHKSQFVILGCFTQNSITWFSISLFCQIGNITALNCHTVYCQINQ